MAKQFLKRRLSQLTPSPETGKVKPRAAALTSAHPQGPVCLGSCSGDELTPCLCLCCVPPRPHPQRAWLHPATCTLLQLEGAQAPGIWFKGGAHPAPQGHQGPLVTTYVPVSGWLHMQGGGGSHSSRGNCFVLFPAYPPTLGRFEMGGLKFLSWGRARVPARVPRQQRGAGAFSPATGAQGGGQTGLPQPLGW